jgi:CxxC motif-containing protein
MNRKLICVECPNGCLLSLEVEGDKIISVTGNQCPKGEAYAASEVLDPRRVLTTTVLTRGLPLKMVPVKTDKPVPKGRIFDAMALIRTIRVERSVKCGDVIFENLLGLNINLVATRGTEIRGHEI